MKTDWTHSDDLSWNRTRRYFVPQHLTCMLHIFRGLMVFRSKNVQRMKKKKWNY